MTLVKVISIKHHHQHTDHHFILVVCLRALVSVEAIDKFTAHMIKYEIDVSAVHKLKTKNSILDQKYELIWTLSESCLWVCKKLHCLMFFFDKILECLAFARIFINLRDDFSTREIMSTKRKSLALINSSSDSKHLFWLQRVRNRQLWLLTNPVYHITSSLLSLLN